MTTASAEQRSRALTALNGLSVGDAFGDRVFFECLFDAHIWQLLIAERPLPSGYWGYTDDTQMALSVVAVLAAHGGIDQDALAQSFGDHFERGRGYGPAMYTLLPQLRAGHNWQTAARALFRGQGSFGMVPRCGLPRLVPFLPTLSMQLSNMPPVPQR